MAISITHPTFFSEQRQRMVEYQIANRGIVSPPVLRAMGRVPREAFVPTDLREFAYEDTPLPIDERQTISQPYIVAAMTELLGLEGGERVLEIGTGSGYQAAVLAEIAAQVVTIERHPRLSTQARAVLGAQGYDHVEVIDGDGTRGWQPAAPYDAILVTAGARSVPDALRQQLAIGGCMVIPVGPLAQQQLLRITRLGEDDFREEVLDGVRFVPLIGEQGWQDPETVATGNDYVAAPSERQRRGTEQGAVELMAAAAEPFDDIQSADLSLLLERIGDARVVCIGEASHGTDEFYRFRARITRELIERHGFDMVAVEADWPDAGRIDHYVRDLQTPPGDWTAFARFPTWMWRNTAVHDFVGWLREHNAGLSEPERVGFHGLDLYSLYTSIDAVVRYLDQVDPQAARVARERYGCLSPWQSDPAAYGRAVACGAFADCEQEVGRMLTELLRKRLDYAHHDGDRFLDAEQNARLVADAEHYYRAMYRGYPDTWNLRDRHMFETVERLLAHRGEDSRLVIWAHNSHLGNATATEMSMRGEYNLGQLCRERFGPHAYLIGFGSHTGTVAAASDWGGSMEIKEVQPSLPESWERCCHDTNIERFMLGLRQPADPRLRGRCQETRLERAIGVIYRPETERASHYFLANLADQFDEYIWFNRSEAVAPLDSERLRGMPDTYPFGL